MRDDSIVPRCSRIQYHNKVTIEMICIVPRCNSMHGGPTDSVIGGGRGVEGFKNIFGLLAGFGF